MVQNGLSWYPVGDAILRVHLLVDFAFFHERIETALARPTLSILEGLL